MIKLSPSKVFNSLDGKKTDLVQIFIYHIKHVKRKHATYISNGAKTYAIYVGSQANT